MNTKHLPLAFTLLLWTGVITAQNYSVPVSDENEKMMEGKFEPTWESLKDYKVPEWFRNAKFGIWAHWGPQCEKCQINNQSKLTIPLNGDKGFIAKIIKNESTILRHSGNERVY